MPNPTELLFMFIVLLAIFCVGGLFFTKAWPKLKEAVKRKLGIF